MAFSLAVMPYFVTEAQAHHTSTGVSKRSDMAIDFQTGGTLVQHSAEKSVHPASLTKIMTLVLVFDALEGSHLALDQKIKISEYAAKIPFSRRTRMKPGDLITVNRAIEATSIISSNNLAVALAEAVAGTEKDFVKAMNKKAKAIGMMHTYFVNASGLNHKKNHRRHVTTAHDMALLCRHLIKNYPLKYEQFFSRPEFRFNSTTYTNHNNLMSYYEGMDGIKTGYISSSGHNLATSVVKKGKRVVAVVFGAASKWERNRLMKNILEDAFDKLKAEKEEEKIYNRIVPQ